MEQIARYLPSSECNSGTERSTDTRKGDALWELFAGMYGSKLTSQFGDECPMAWHRILDGLTQMEIGRGIRWLRDEGREWPPSATEFWALCRKPEAPRPMPYKALPSPPADPEIARKHLDAMRERLR